MQKHPKQGTKFDVGKPELDLIPYEALEQISKGLTFGASKYGRWNWRQGFKWSRIYSALQRHLGQWNNGEDLDPESGISHLSHAACNLVFLLQFLTECPELDNRYKLDSGKKQRSRRAKKSSSKLKK